MRLALDFEKVGDAAEGRLKPGGTGVVETVDTSLTQPHYLVMGWWYGEGALQGAEVHAAALLAMLHAHPAAAAVCDGNGSLPLHIAVFCQAPQEVFQALLAAHPAAAAEKDKGGRTPLHAAIDAKCPMPVLAALLAAAPCVDLGARARDFFVQGAGRFYAWCCFRLW